MKPTEHLSGIHDMRRVLRQLARLVEISVTLNSTLDPERLLQHIIDTAADMLECEAVSILLYDENKEELRFAASTDSDWEHLEQIPVPIKNSIAGNIFRQNSYLVINDLKNDPRHFQKVSEELEFEPRSMVGVPMRIRDKVTGVLEGLNKKEGEFTFDDAKLLSVIASQAAVAIHNAELMNNLKAAYEEIARIDKIKSDFIAIASHELRTPLGLIIGYAQFLKDDAEGELSEHAEMVLQSSDRMRSLIDDMTTMSMLQMGSLPIEFINTVLQEVLVSAYKELREAGEVKKHTITMNLPRDPVNVKANAKKLEIVFIKLLDNAIRFTPEGGEIVIDLVQDENMAKVSIRDNGIGITKEEISKIFRNFYQVEHYLTRTHGGMGIGLTIAQGLVELHQGKIWVESEGENKGSTFHVQLPVSNHFP